VPVVSDDHDVPVRPLTSRSTSRRSRLTAAIVLSGLVAIVAVGLVGPQVVRTTRLASAALPAAGASPAPSRVVARAARPARLLCSPSPTPFDPGDFDLTGVWTGVDGGVYYIRQEGTAVWWSGLSEWAGPASDLGSRWATVGHGSIDALAITAEWANVPRGAGQASGTLVLEIQDNGQGNIQIVTRRQSGGFGNTLWLPASCRMLSAVP